MSGSIRMIVAWFRPEDWEELKRLCPAGDLQDTYEEWVSPRCGPSCWVKSIAL